MHRAHFDGGRWKQECTHFIDYVCQLWSLPYARDVVERVPLQLADATAHGHENLSNLPAMVAHEADQQWSHDSHCLSIVVDCEVLANLLNGTVASMSEEHQPVFRRMARALASLLGREWRPRTPRADMVEWRPRKYNVQADRLANYAMNSACRWESVDSDSLRDALRSGCNIRLCSDGGLRYRDGSAGCAWVLYCVQRHGEAWIFSMLGHAGFHVSGATSAFVAEILALDAALATLSLVL